MDASKKYPYNATSHSELAYRLGRAIYDTTEARTMADEARGYGEMRLGFGTTLAGHGRRFPARVCRPEDFVLRAAVSEQGIDSPWI